MILHLACVGATMADAIALCEMVSEDFAVQAFAMSADDLTSEDARQQLELVDGVVTTVLQLHTLRRAVDRERLPVFLARIDTLRPGTLVGTSQPQYVIARQRRWAERLISALGNSANTHDLHFLVVGEDDLSTIPREAAVYVTPSALPLVSGLASFHNRISRLRYELQPAHARRLIAAIVKAKPS